MIGGRGDTARTLRVLVVEDSVDAAEILGELLKVWGHDVRLAYDGAGGLKAAREFRPEVILLDIGLPDTDGYAVAAELRRNGLGGLLLVALTGYSEAQDRARAQEAGFDRHLTKPVDPEALLGLLRDGVGSSSSPSSS